MSQHARFSGVDTYIEKINRDLSGRRIRITVLEPLSNEQFASVVKALGGVRAKIEFLTAEDVSILSRKCDRDIRIIDEEVRIGKIKEDTF